MNGLIQPGGLWVYCEQGPDGIRPVRFNAAGLNAVSGAAAAAQGDEQG